MAEPTAPTPPLTPTTSRTLPTLHPHSGHSVESTPRTRSKVFEFIIAYFSIAAVVGLLLLMCLALGFLIAWTIFGGYYFLRTKVGGQNFSIFWLSWKGGMASSILILSVTYVNKIVHGGEWYAVWYFAMCETALVGMGFCVLWLSCVGMVCLVRCVRGRNSSGRSGEVKDVEVQELGVLRVGEAECAPERFTFDSDDGEMKKQDGRSGL